MPASQRGVQVALSASAVAALIILLGLFSPAVSVAALVVIVLGTVLTAPAASGGSWWALLAAGAALSVGAALLQFSSDTLGGLVAVIGGLLVLIAVSLGFPLENE